MTPTAAKRFIIVTTARSGSNLLVDYVNQTPVATCFGEIFKKAFFNAAGNDKNFQLIASCFPTLEEAKKAQLDFPEHFWNVVVAKNPGDSKYIGAKLFYEHREKHRLWHGLFKQNPLIIHLWRASVLDSFLSLERAKATQQWTIRDGQNKGQKNPPLIFDEDRYVEYRNLSRLRFQRTRARQGETESYEEIEYAQVADPAVIGPILNRIFETDATYTQTLVKQGPPDRLDNIQNRDVAEKYLEDRLDG